MKIRSLTEEDLESAAKLYASVFSAAPWSEPWRETTAYVRLRHFYNSPGFSGVLAEASGRIAGLAV
jgi:aminoglycoside 6'-N-acetyltransferase I